ncbi:hypothetical protein [Arthrobacter pigmenti]
MEDKPPPVAGLSRQVPPESVPQPPSLDTQSVIEAADLAHHRVRRSIHAIASMSHRAVDFFARHQGAPDVGRLERGRDEVQLQLYRSRGMR